MRKQIIYRAEFLTEGGAYPLMRHLEKLGVEYKIEQDVKNSAWLFQWKQ